MISNYDVESLTYYKFLDKGSKIDDCRGELHSPAANGNAPKGVVQGDSSRRWTETKWSIVERGADALQSAWPLIQDLLQYLMGIDVRKIIDM